MKTMWMLVLGLLGVFFAQCDKNGVLSGDSATAKKMLKDGGIWYVNRFEINGVDSSFNVYAKEKPDTRQLVFIKTDKKANCDYLLKALSVEWGFNMYGGNSTMYMTWRDLACGCPQGKGCIRDIFYQGKVPTNKMTWNISMPNEDEIVLFFEKADTYRIVMNRSLAASLTQ